jgi:hypothetical protein
MGARANIPPAPARTITTRPAVAAASAAAPIASRNIKTDYKKPSDAANNNPQSNQLSGASTIKMTAAESAKAQAIYDSRDFGKYT